jgi:hypothetical protein
MSYEILPSVFSNFKQLHTSWYPKLWFMVHTPFTNVYNDKNVKIKQSLNRPEQALRVLQS